MVYDSAFGHLVNLNKYVVCFSYLVREILKGELSSTLGIPLVQCHKKYLGLPCFTGKIKNGLFQSLRDRVWNKLFG